MKIVSLNSIVIFVSIMVLISLSNTPPVDSGPAATAACILACCGTACASASTVCKFKLPSLNCGIIEQGWLEIIRVIDTRNVYIIIYSLRETRKSNILEYIGWQARHHRNDRGQEGDEAGEGVNWLT